MRIMHALMIVMAVAACGKKQDEPAGAASGSSEQKPIEAPAPACPSGSLADSTGKCVAVITAEKVEAVAQQQSRIDELGQLLDKVDVASAPIELLDGLRQTEQWKTLAAGSDKLKVVDSVVATLNDAIKKLREFRASLGDVSTRLGNLKGELDQLMKNPAVGGRLDEVRTRISGELRAAIEPFAAKVADTIQNALTPLVAQLSDTADLVTGACAMAKLSGGGDQLKKLCAQSKDVFAKALAYLDDLKAKPAALFDDVSSKLSTELGQLVDQQTTQLISAAQAKVNEVLKLPAGGGPAGTMAGSAAK